MSISKALTSNFENIFYVDLVTDYYLEFYTGEEGRLEIRPGGAGFFEGARQKLLDSVFEADREMVANATDKASLVRWAGQEEENALSFRMVKDGQPTPYCLQTIRTRESDNHHILIGVRPEER